MDSMRNLRNYLPAASSARRQASKPPQQLLQAFKQAAQTVTSLYQQAAIEQADAYQEGYRDALEELLSFLDKEELGLQDGEGWSVRQWATERFQGTEPRSGNGAESDEEGEQPEKRERVESPNAETKSSEETQHRRQESEKPVEPEPTLRSESAPPATHTAISPETDPRSTSTLTAPSSDFTFRSTQMPASSDVEMDSSPEARNWSGTNGPVQVNFVPRLHRNGSRHTGNSRTNNRQNINLQLGTGAGSKRRAPFEGFFDISGLNGKDGSGGGGKRGRFT